jgi:hypothetical protein
LKNIFQQITGKAGHMNAIIPQKKEEKGSWRIYWRQYEVPPG